MSSSQQDLLELRVTSMRRESSVMPAYATMYELPTSPM